MGSAHSVQYISTTGPYTEDTPGAVWDVYLPLSRSRLTQTFQLPLRSGYPRLESLCVIQLPRACVSLLHRYAMLCYLQ